MKNQELFDRAVSALIAQGRPSYDRVGEQCLYRGPRGSRCAIGHLIPDAKYTKQLEGRGVYADEVRRAAGLLVTQESLAAAIQSAHDSPATDHLTGRKWLAEFMRRARAVAERFGLSAKVLDDVERPQADA